MFMCRLPVSRVIGKVMWPRLVASKILRKRLGSNNFVADFPASVESDSVLLNLPSFASEPAVASQADIFSDYEGGATHLYRIFVSTWNVGGVTPADDLDMDDLFDMCHTPCDIYVLGFQEVVPLRAVNVLGSDKSRTCMKWNSLIRESLNKKLRINEEVVYEKQIGKSSISPPQEFLCLISKQMVGILISVWVRSDIRPYIQNPSVCCVGCGVMGCLGNKGSVSVRFQLHETSFCFVCSHLASGGKDRDERARNDNVAEIFSRTIFPRGVSLDLPRKILDHDRIIFLGDLNYRISLPESTTRLLVNTKDWNALLENDQLRAELMDGQAFEGWREGEVNFAPTYKYYPNTDEYYGCILMNKGEKKRSPAWCDRIIWYGDGLEQDAYTRAELQLSDHRPVRAIFSTETRVSLRLKSIFFSERFDRIRNGTDMPLKDEYIYKTRSSFRL